MLAPLIRLVVMAGAALVILCMVGLLVRAPHQRARRLAWNAGTGLALLGILHWVLPGLGLGVPVNLLSLAAAAGLGVPGVVLAVALHAVL